MDYPPSNNHELYSSFNKIGNEIDDIFQTMDVFKTSTSPAPLKSGVTDNNTLKGYHDNQEYHVDSSSRPLRESSQSLISRDGASCQSFVLGGSSVDIAPPPSDLYQTERNQSVPPYHVTKQRGSISSVRSCSTPRYVPSSMTSSTFISPAAVSPNSGRGYKPSSVGVSNGIPSVGVSNGLPWQSPLHRNTAKAVETNSFHGFPNSDPGGPESGMFSSTPSKGQQSLSDLKYQRTTSPLLDSHLDSSYPHPRETTSPSLQPHSPTSTEYRRSCERHQEQVNTLRSRVLQLTNRIQGTVEERNKNLFKLESALRELCLQGTQKQQLGEKVQTLNQKMLESDHEINQLKVQVLELDKEVERSQGKQEELLEMVDTGKRLLNREKMEKSAATKHADRLLAERGALQDKYQYLEHVHARCGSLQETSQTEYAALQARVRSLTESLGSLNQEREALLQNLTRLHKLVDKLERKAGEKIGELTNTLTSMCEENAAQKEAAVEREAVLSHNRAYIRDLESKVGEGKRELEQVREQLESRESAGKETISTKNKKIKLLSMKVRQLQTSLSTTESQVQVLRESGERRETELKRDLEQRERCLQTLEERVGSEGTCRDLEESVRELVGQREQIQTSLDRLQECNSLQEMELQELRLQETRSVVEREETGGRLVRVFEEKEGLVARLGASEREVRELRESLKGSGGEVESLCARLGEAEHVQSALYAKLEGRERKLGRMREVAEEALTGRQETEMELMELRTAVQCLESELETQNMHNHQLSQLLEGRCGEETYTEGRGAEEGYKEGRRGEEAISEGNVDLVLRVSELERENEELASALQRTKDKHGRLKREFGQRIREQNDIIDNCVDKDFAENQISQLQSFYEAKLNELEVSQTT